MNLRNKSPFYTLFTPRMMSNRQLPTYLDILQHYTYVTMEYNKETQKCRRLKK